MVLIGQQCANTGGPCVEVGTITVPITSLLFNSLNQKTRKLRTSWFATMRSSSPQHRVGDGQQSATSTG